MNNTLPGHATRPTGTGAIIYEVNLDVDALVIDAYRDWLDDHVAEILALPGFVDARILEVVEPAAASDRVTLCVHYALRDAAALEAYLRDHAARLRADGQARFDGRFNASRRILRTCAGASA